MDKDEAAKELVDIKESFKEKAPSMRPYFRFMGAWLVLFLLAYGGIGTGWQYKCVGDRFDRQLLCLVDTPDPFVWRTYHYGRYSLSAFQQFVGINVVLYYAPEIFQDDGGCY